MSATRIDWGHVLNRAKSIVFEYDTPVTLRQLFYRLVAAGVIPNVDYTYKRLSEQTAKARRLGTFPPLLDRTRLIHRGYTFKGIHDATTWLTDIYHRDRTEGQAVSLYLGVEKHGLVEQLQLWFSDFGIPILSLGGYASQSFVDKVRFDIQYLDRPAVLIYAGDFDPSGEDIPRDFVDRVGLFEGVEHIALTREQVKEYNLPPQPGKASDSRAKGFIAKYGELVQVELDALPPDKLKLLFMGVIAPVYDLDIMEGIIKLELEEKEQLKEMLGT